METLLAPYRTARGLRRMRRTNWVRDVSACTRGALPRKTASRAACICDLTAALPSVVLDEDTVL